MRIRAISMLLMLFLLVSCGSTPHVVSPVPVARTYRVPRPAAVGDFMTLTIDSSAHTIAYTDLSNGDSGTVPYTVNSDGTYTLNDPKENPVAAHESPNYATLIQAIKGQLKDLQTGQSSAASTPPGTPATTTDVDSSSQRAAVQEQLGVSTRFGLQLRGFGHVGFSATDERGTHGATVLGDLDLLLTSRISTKANVLGEILFEPGDAGTFKVDVERLLLQVHQNDYFSVGLGRFHTGIGFYNSYFHHGNYMQTTTDRPLPFDFADDGGILPTGNVGITVSGRLPSGRLGLGYLAEFGSQDTRRKTFNGTEVDLENGNSTNFGVVARPEAWPGVETGFSFYRDSEKPAGLPPLIRENILAAHVVVLRRSFEWLNEGLVIRHAPVGSTEVFSTPAFYSQLSHRFGAYRPYFRYQYVNARDDEPVLGDVRRREGPSVGLRYDFESAAMKLQYDHTLVRNQPSVNGITGQVAFTF